MAKDERVLYRCPCCGGYARVFEDMRFMRKPYDFPKWYVCCRECGLRTPTATIDIVVKRWNRRVDMEGD